MTILSCRIHQFCKYMFRWCSFRIIAHTVANRVSFPDWPLQVPVAFRNRGCIHGCGSTSGEDWTDTFASAFKSICRFTRNSYEGAGAIWHTTASINWVIKLNGLQSAPCMQETWLLQHGLAEPVRSQCAAGKCAHVFSAYELLIHPQI